MNYFQVVKLKLTHPVTLALHLHLKPWFPLTFDALPFFQGSMLNHFP